jgi:hypothetical protein
VNRPAKLFELNRKGLNLQRGFMVAGVIAVLTAVLLGLGHDP